MNIAAKLSSDPQLGSHELDSITTVPYSRWDLDSLWHGASTLRARFGAFLPAVDQFDCSAFAISVPEAELIDPQQRLLLEVHD